MKKLVALIAFAFYGTTLATAQVSVPKVTGPIPVTAESFPFLAASRVQEVVDLAKAGYVEEEFIVSGLANVYDWAAAGSISVKAANAPYTTRILVRRPSTPARFSGNVILEPLENARRFDWSFLWAISHDYFIEHGDAWVGVTHTPAGIESLKKFNATRYASLSLANPVPDERCEQGNVTSDGEEGLRFDIMSQLAALFKGNAATSPMPGFNVQYMYATSHTGELVTYIHAINLRARLGSGKPAYDGFLIQGDSAPARIRRCADAPAAGDPRRITRNAGVPVIRAIPQGDVLGAFNLRRQDSDEANDRYRLYEVTAAARMDVSFYRHMPSTQDQAAAGQPAFPGIWPFAYQCDPPIALMELPVYQYTLNAAFANLDRWARNGTAPPKAERIGIENGGTPQAKFVTDQYGNAVGGVRSPYVDVPAATYFPNSPGQAICRNIGHKISFDWTRLETLYGSSKNYGAKVGESVDRLARDRWVTEPDARKMKAEMVAPR